MKITLTVRNKLRCFWGLLVVAIACLVGIMVYPPTWLPFSFFVILMCIFAETIVLTVILGVLRKIDMLASWEIGAYFVFVVGMILGIAFVSSPLDGRKLIFYALSVSALFIFLNISLSKVVFGISFWKAGLIGVIAGLINALMAISGTYVIN